MTFERYRSENLLFLKIFAVLLYCQEEVEKPNAANIYLPALPSHGRSLRILSVIPDKKNLRVSFL